MSPELPSSESSLPVWGPPRFSLRTLFLTITLFGCLFAAVAALGAVKGSVVVLAVLLILAHVFGNSIGTRLRNSSDRAIQTRDTAQNPAVIAPILQHQPPVRLAGNVRLHRVVPVTLLSAVTGAMLGGVGLAYIYPEAPAAAIGLGVVSSAVLGGFAGFVTSSFVAVFRQAWDEALVSCDSRGNRPR